MMEEHYKQAFIKVQRDRQKLIEQNKRYREALEFYADSKNWLPQNDNVLSEITMDYGSIARKALEGEE